MQIEGVRHAIGNAGRAAGNSQSLAAKQLVFAIHQPYIHADLPCQILLVRRLQAGAGVTCIFDCHPRMLQKQPLLRIDVFCFFRRNIKEQRIEFVDPGNKATPLAVMLSTLTAIVAKVFPPVPALPGNFDDAIPTLTQIVPIGVDIDRFRIPAAQANNGDRLGFRCRAGGNDSAHV